MIMNTRKVDKIKVVNELQRKLYRNSCRMSTEERIKNLQEQEVLLGEL